MTGTQIQEPVLAELLAHSVPWKFQTGDRVLCKVIGVYCHLNGLRCSQSIKDCWHGHQYEQDVLLTEPVAWHLNRRMTLSADLDHQQNFRPLRAIISKKCSGLDPNAGDLCILLLGATYLEQWE